MTECIFCKIAAGEGQASIFYQDDAVLGFMDVNPVNEGHALIIPRRHAAHLADLDEETGRHIFAVAQRTAAAIRQSGLKCEGIDLFLADGEAAGQEISHVHMHVFPRYRGDPFRLSVDRGARPSRQELDRVAELIRSAYCRLQQGGRRNGL